MAPSTGGSDATVEVFGRAGGGDPARGGSRSVAVVAKRHAVSEQTIYTWRKRFGTIGGERRAAAEGVGGRECAAEEACRRARPRDRGDEGDRRKKLVSVRVRREAVGYATGRGLSQRRTCTLLSVARSALAYQRANPRPTRRHWRGWASSRAGIHATATGASASFSGATVIG